MTVSYNHLPVRKMLTRVSHVLFLLLFGFVTVSGYSDVAGSCDSASCGHHGHTPRPGDGGYKLVVNDSQTIYSPGQVFFGLDH